ncbi:MAG: hypothetical protein CME71_11535 [Halobacteriovorax sp.]|nr:hypothetical protein [Halobacteriovorax sp.]|tara:strand:+ start:1088 stop:2014 length:927 start_codon:yes stop_codon:yes gene_type:complete
MKSLFSILFTLALFPLTACATLSDNMFDTLKKDERFTILTQAIELTDLSQTVSHNKLTLFAPTDAAFKKLPASTLNDLLANPEALKSVLLFHVVDGKVKSKKLVKKVGLVTLSDEFLAIESLDLLETDIKVSNGVIHALSSVLTPSAIPADPSTTEIVDIEKYMGLWFEIGRYANRFQDECGQTTANYSLRDDGKVDVLNTCKLKANPAELQQGKAIASIKNTETNAVLSVSFVPFFNRFGLFGGDYRILELGADYEWVMVGDAKREFFWILARTAELDETLYEDLKARARLLGYDSSKILKSPTWQD